MADDMNNNGTGPADNSGTEQSPRPQETGAPAGGDAKRPEGQETEDGNNGAPA